MNLKRMTTKEKVCLSIRRSKEKGLTAPEFLVLSPELKPQTVYPCFTQLCRAKKILDSKRRRKSSMNRRSIVWVDAQYEGVIPVWGSGQPSYSYKNRAKIVMDLLRDHGPLSVSEMMPCSPLLKPMSASSLVSRLVRQNWVHKTKKTRRNWEDQLCCLYALTPRGCQVVSQACNKKGYRYKPSYGAAPKVRINTEKTRD